jgi:hypothetical protein
MPDSPLDYLKLFLALFTIPVVFWGLRILFFLAFVYAIVYFITSIWTRIKPFFYNEEEKRRNRRRQRFAKHIIREIERINSREEWSDHRFAELEAEVEMEGRRRNFKLLKFFNNGYKGIRREKSLTRALKHSDERLILIEGDPGSGKSVALRHVAIDLDDKANHSRYNRTVIPLFINLKELRLNIEETPNSQQIKDFILSTLNRVNDRDIDVFLQEEFDRGLSDGSWLFLFDSFDEIPSILGARDADPVIHDYAEAIADFLGGMNQCKGIIASRYFRGPGQVGWPTFRIVSLSGDQQNQLLNNSDLPISQLKILKGDLQNSNVEIRQIASNPLFLGLIIDHIRSNKPFPDSTYQLFDNYVDHRFKRDEERLFKRFHISIDYIHQIAQQTAFCMATNQGLGLSPTRLQLIQAIEGLNPQELIDRQIIHKCYDALEYIKLGRSESDSLIGDERPFTFSHRRFQEYFATFVVRKNPTLITPCELLKNARWRETAVVLCQILPLSQLEGILVEIDLLLNNFSNDLIKNNLIKNDQNEGEIINIIWPAGLLHLLSLLQEGFSNRKKILPNSIREKVGMIVSYVNTYGSLSDRKWMLEVAGLASQDILLECIRPAINSASKLLPEIAYRQVARLDEIPDDVNLWIIKSFLRRLGKNRLNKELNSIEAYLSRLNHSEIYRRKLRDIRWFSHLDFIGVSLVSVISLISLLYFSMPNSTDIFNNNNWVIPLIIPSIWFLLFDSPLLIQTLDEAIKTPVPNVYFTYADFLSLRFVISILIISSFYIRIPFVALGAITIFPFAYLNFLIPSAIYSYTHNSKYVNCFVCPFYVFTYFPNLISVIFKKKNHKKIILLIVLSISSYIIIKFLLNNTIILIFLIAMVSAIFASIYGFANICKRIIFNVIDQIYLYHISEELKKPIAFGILFDHMNKLRDIEIKIKLISLVRRHNSLCADTTTELSLRDKILKLEKSGISNISLLLDELCLLLEQTRNKITTTL